MATYTHQTKRCPHCGKVIEKRTVTGPYPKESLVKFTGLFATCPFCGKGFRDSDACELAVMDPPKGYLTKFHTSTVVLAAVFGMIGLFVIIKGTEAAANPLGAVLLVWAIGGLVLFSDYRRYTRHTKTIEIERARSVERLKKDPAYAKLLEEAGFSIPEECRPGR